MFFLVFFLIIIIAGVFMSIMGVYIKKQMMIAEGPPSPKQVQASQFIDKLTESADGDFVRVFNLTQAILVLGLIVMILGGVMFLANLHHLNLI